MLIYNLRNSHIMPIYLKFVIIVPNYPLFIQYYTSIIDYTNFANYIIPIESMKQPISVLHWYELCVIWIDINSQNSQQLILSYVEIMPHSDIARFACLRHASC